jgi:ABC-type nitrate/sulfonate/bicarbonate transport system substrate-binding protein
MMMGSGAPRAQEPLRVVAFAGASNWPLWIGQEKGLFKAAGVDVALDFTPNSVELIKNLHTGKYELALTAIDNAIAYDENQGEADLGGPADFVALFGIENGLLSIVSVPEIKSLGDLRGKTLSVDAPTTGFSFVLKEMLSRSGIKESEVQIVRVGGGAQRLEALLKRDQAATLLNTPLDIVAEGKGFNRLLIATDVLGAYLGICGIAKREAAAKDRARFVAFIRAFHASVAWLVAPDNREEAIAILTTKMKGLERLQAEQSYARLTDAKSGVFRDLRIDSEGLKTVLRLRSTYAVPPMPLTNVDRYVDGSFLAEALAK